MTCIYPGCDASATHVYDLDDHRDDPAHYCGVHAPNLARRLGRITGVGRPGSTPPTGPGTAPASGLNDKQVEALRLLADPTVTDVRTYRGRTRRKEGRGRVVVEVNQQTRRALVRRGLLDDDGACRLTPAGRRQLEEVGRG